MVKRLWQEAVEDILRLHRAAYEQVETCYRQAVKITMRWIKNDCEGNFRRLRFL